MKSRISFFKPIALKKDILRYAPIWALYLIGMMMVLMEMGYYTDYDNYARNFMSGYIMAFGVVNICYAGLCAVMLFGDLYNTKLCYSLHAMPYRRESWLLTHLLSGLLFSLVPNLVACVYMMFRLEAYCFLALYWLLAATLQFLFFYGLATVSAMLTGNRFAMLAVYAGFNFVAMLLYGTITVIYIPMFTGVVANLTDFSRFSPVVYLFDFDYFKFTTVETNYADIYDSSKYFNRYDGLADGWGYLAILAAVGIAAMGVAVWLYRKRHLESAGDFVAFPRLKGISCVIITMCVALCFALVGESVGSGYMVWLAVGLTVGYFGSLMLLERRLKVLRKKTLLGFLALAIVVVLSMCAMVCDWFGIESWTPEADHVQSVTVSNRRPNNSYYDYGGSYLSVTLEDQADIADIIDAHKDILSGLDSSDSNGDTYRVTLTYKLKSGRTVVRSYSAPANGAAYRTVRQYLYTSSSLLGFTDAAAAAKTVTYMYCDQGEVPPQLYEAVFQALQSDCAAGYVLPQSSKGEYYIDYGFVDEKGNRVDRYLAIMAGASNYVALLKGPELNMGYADWEKFLSSIETLEIQGTEIPVQVSKAEREALLTALRKDIEAGNVQAYIYISDSPVVYYTYYAENGGFYEREFYIPKEAEHINAWIQQQLLTE